MKGNQIDDLFRQKLSHQKLNPPPAAWGAIEQNLPAKKKKGAYFWMRIAASLLVIFTMGWLLIGQGQNNTITTPEPLAKTETPEAKETPAKADKPVQSQVAKEEATPEIIQEDLIEAPAQKLVAQTDNTPQYSIEKSASESFTLEELPLREPMAVVAMIRMDKRMAPAMTASPFKYEMLMPLELTAFYTPYSEDIELSPRKKRFRVLNGIISIAKEANKGKLSFSELRNAKNSFVEDDLKYGGKEDDSDTEDVPESPRKD